MFRSLPRFIDPDACAQERNTNDECDNAAVRSEEKSDVGREGQVHVGTAEAEEAVTSYVS